jgi:hypothetical protein
MAKMSDRIAPPRELVFAFDTASRIASAMGSRNIALHCDPVLGSHIRSRR